MRFRDLDRNRNGQIERGEWRGSPRSFPDPRLEQRRRPVGR
jgi:hypothetical protein